MFHLTLIYISTCAYLPITVNETVRDNFGVRIEISHHRTLQEKRIISKIQLMRALSPGGGTPISNGYGCKANTSKGWGIR